MLLAALFAAADVRLTAGRAALQAFQHAVSFWRLLVLRGSAAHEVQVLHVFLPLQHTVSAAATAAVAGVGYRKTLMPVLEKLQEQGKAEEALGVPLDIADTGFVLSNKEHFVLLDDWCNRR